MLRMNSAKDRIEAKRAAFAKDLTLHGPRLGLDTLCYSTGDA
jgi:hypothetical protein